VRNIADVTTAVANGDLSRKITVDVKGEILELKNTINTMVDQLSSFASEVTRVAREVGTEGKLGGQAYVAGVAGTWKDLTDNVNSMASNLTGQVRNIADVTTAVANGDLSRKITVDVKGEILELKNTINTMVDQLSSFASEVTRVAREVGTEGKLGGQAEVRGVAGTWKDLTDSVNMMAGNLTEQVRGIARVVTAVANGDLNQKLVLAEKGEIAALADTINFMIDTLATFADQVTGVAREVGVEGRLGGQANVPGAAGTWRDLTDNVNQLAASLTTQLRAIADVATAVTKGDLTRSINVAASGEVALLKDNINQMISNLRETSLKNTEQDWLKTNLAKFTRMLQGQKDLLEVGRLILSELAPVVAAHQGVFYIMDSSGMEPVLKLLASYAYRERKSVANRFRLGEGLVGQTALEKQRILLTNVPSDYIQISSGLGEATPLNIVVMPVVFEGQVKAIVELASFEKYTDTHLTFLDQLTDSIGIVLNTIEANMRTEELLKQSQSLAQELTSRQQELQQTNAELEEKARQLADQNMEVERKNREVELAKEALEEKASQLALTSKYKSEFLANMSHELRTPLNSLLILSRQLADNPEGNLSGRQVEYAQTINGAGSDLLSLINDILDLSKIESGTVTLDIEEVPFLELEDFVERTFRHVGEQKGLEFIIETDPNLPGTMHTDPKRLQQVLKNLLANAFKFTEQGHVKLRMHRAKAGYSPTHPVLSKAEAVVAFSVEDTGIGIPLDKQAIIFEAFQQAEGATNRKYGGTGLGLSISREIARLLGGEIRLSSTPGIGSTFVLYVPLQYVSTSPGNLPDEQHGDGNGNGDGEGDGNGNAISGGAYSGATSYATAAGGIAAGGGGAATLSSSERRAGGSSDRAVYTPTTRAEHLRQAGLELPDDRTSIRPGDKIMLIVEDDRNFAKVLLEVAQERGFKGLIASRGDTALALSHGFRPDAITLDIFLPDIDGFTVLDRLKTDSNTRHIPVTIVSVDEERARGIKRGAFEVLTKPVQRETLEEVFQKTVDFLARRQRRLLIVEDDERDRNAIMGLIGNGDVVTTAVGSAEEAIEAATSGEGFDCIVLDLLLPGMSGFEAIEQLQKHEATKFVPIVVYTGKDLTKDEEVQLNKLVHSVIVKDVRSPERLLDETSLFLHRPMTSLPEEKRKMLDQLHDPARVLANKRALIVDDDSRNIFAMSSILERNQMQVMAAESGREAVSMLERQPEVDLVLMDIMMPDMDGYETIRAIREIPRFKSLPIIAVTAKAMKGDREKCIEAGASDYITKPVDQEQLLSMMRMWLHR
jgi:CheY-like chemotaxis protein/signal transduction histidine kinase/HAMP domain-containing protein